MTRAARQLLDRFEELPGPDRQEVVVEILRRTVEEDTSAPGDEELLLAADQVFLELDRREGSE